MQQWHALMNAAVTQGTRKQDRTGVGTYSIFGTMARFNMRHGFPAVTTKELKWPQMIGELAGFLAGATTLEQFHSFGCTIWDANAKQTSHSLAAAEVQGDVGRIYGAQWRDWRSIVPGDEEGGRFAIKSTDQLQVLVEGLKTNPYGRRHLVTAWNPGELSQMCLPPCHLLWQCNVRPHEYSAPHKPWLDMRVDMRSVDLFLGLPFNIASYAVLLHVLAQEVGMMPGDLVFQMGDTHLYTDHVDQFNTVQKRDAYPLPMLQLDPSASVFNFQPEMAKLVGYQHHPHVPAPMHA